MQADSGTTTDRGPGTTRGPVAVIGAGLTGASWAGLYAAAGLEVRLYDVDLGRLEAAVERAAAAAGFLAGSGLADMQTAERGVELLTGTADLAAAVAGVTHVQECVREDLAIKREVFAAVSAAAPADALICSSSSGLSISDIQTAATRPGTLPRRPPLQPAAPGAARGARTRRADVAGGDGPRRGLLRERRQRAGQAHARPARLPGQPTLRRALARGRGPRAARRRHRGGRRQGRELRPRPALGRHGSAPALRPRRRRRRHRRPRPAPRRGQGGHAPRPRDVDDVPARDRPRSWTPA